MSGSSQSRLRLVAALFVAAVVVASCASAADEEAVDGSPSTSVGDGAAAPSTDTVAPGAPGASAPPDTDGGSAGPGAAPTTTGASPGAGPTPTTTTPAPVPPVSGVGGYAAFYLRPSESARIVLDVHSQSGAAPTGDTIAHVRSLLADVAGKEIALNGGTVAGDARSWTADDIRSLADRTGIGQSRDGAVLKLLFLRGDFADSDTVLGVAVRSDVAAIFSDKVDEAAGPLVSSGRVETAVTTHEVGHLLGLVDLVLDTGREDPEHPGHSSNRESVMYWAVESTLVGSLLEGGPPTTLDAADRADLATIRNG